jgi:chromosome segregation ATPase
MAKIITPPSINDLDGLLDLMLHPDKGLDYLKQLHAMREAILDSLGVVKTKEEADALLAQASASWHEAKRQVQSATDEIQAKMREAKQDVEKMRAQAKALDEQSQQRLKDLREREEDVQVRAKKLDAVAVSQAEKAQELAGLEITLNSRAAYLDKEEAKLKQLKSLMTSHGV